MVYDAAFNGAAYHSLKAFTNRILIQHTAALMKRLLRIFASVCALLSLFPAKAEETGARSAVEDWVPRSLLSPAQQAELQPYCSGTYIEPAYGFLDGTEVQDGELRARAEDAHLNEQDRIQLRGNVQVQQGLWWLEADQVDVDKVVNKAYIKDNIKARIPGLLLQGEAARYDLEAQSFSFDQASYLLHDRHARGDAEQIISTGKNEIRIVEGSFTTCAPRKQHWALEADEILLDREAGQGTAKHMRLTVQEVPLFYVPYLVFPIDDRRKSGFLYPTISNSSAGVGLDLGAPYYFNLDEYYDATLAPRYIHRRGALAEIEGRLLTEQSYSEVRLGFMPRDADYLDRNPNEDRGDRWALDITNEFAFGDYWDGELDYNVLSDSDYLNDLNRTLEIQKDSHIKRYWLTNYRRDRLNFSARMLGYQTIDESIAEADQPYSLLPQLTLDWRQEVSWLDVQLESEFSYFWRDSSGLVDAERAKGARWQTEPSVVIDMNAPWGFLRPGLRLDHTDYLLQEQEPELSDHIGRTVPFYTLDTGVYLDREVEFWETDLIQSLEPRLFYVYSPETDQDEIPVFDTSVPRFDYSQLYTADRFYGGDRVGDNNRLSVGLETVIRNAENGEEKLRAGIGQIIYFEPGDVYLSSSTSDEDGRITESESPLAGEVFWRPNPRVDFKLNGVWDQQEKETLSGSAALSFHSTDYSTLLNLSHRYRNDTDETIEQTDVSLLFPATSSINLFGRWLYDLDDRRTIGTLAGVEYSSCCWRVQFFANAVLEDDDADGSVLDHGFFLRFQLRGLGNIGNGDLDKVIGNEIRHYDEHLAYRENNYRW